MNFIQQITKIYLFVNLLKVEQAQIKKTLQKYIKCKDQNEQLEFKDILNNKYNKFVKNYLITGLNNCIEIISSSTDKSIAIKEIAQIENVEKNKIFTVGDSFNDLEMLETFNGFCMKNSEEFVKSKITKMCISVAEVIDEISGGTNE